jgi:autotransporter strand-loop-strand O-heptosyltransferase
MTTELIEFVSQSLGDNIAWSPYGYEYHKVTGNNIVVKTRWAELFEDIGDKVRFISNQTLSPEASNSRKINFFLNKEKPIQKQICDQLNIPFKEIKPTIIENNLEKYNKPKSKYVCISVQSTVQCKYWKESGWIKVVKFLKGIGYKVLCIDKDYSFGIEGRRNIMPKGAKDETGNYPIGHRVNQIRDCEFFIGLSSGLSWLAWALGKKVVLISGSTKAINEFRSNCFRVQNKSVCHGCLNDESLGSLYDPPWDYCPKDKNWECYKKISFEMVKDQIIKCINTKQN